MGASFTSTSMTRDNLLLEGDVVTKPITLLSGQNLLRGSVLGGTTLGAVSKAAKAGGNTGAGTLVLDVTAPLQPSASPGIYMVRVTHVGEFEVLDPKGASIGVGEYAAGGAATFSDRVKFAFTDDGTTHFIVGDGFDITVAAGTGKYILSALADVDGTQIPDCILAQDTNASAGDVATIAYFNATVNQNALIFGTGQTIANCMETLRTKDIQLVDVKTTY
jgi:hypothetical protein